MEALELKQKTFYSVIWTMARVGSSSTLSFIVFAMLARLLSPTAFGVFALASAFVEIAKIFSAAGLSDTIVQARHLDEELATSAFWANVVIGVLAGAATWALARIYAGMVGEPTVAPVLEWLSALVPVSALGAIHTARKLREFGHRSVAARTITAGALGGGSAILAATHGFGVWSLAVQAMVNEGIGLLFAWHMFPWLPRLKVSWPRLGEVGGLSGGLMLSQLLFLLLIRAQDVMIGAFLTASAVGAYRIAWRMFELITQTTLFPITTVSMVTLARLQGDRTAFANAYGRMLGLAALFVLPTLLGFGMLSDDLVASLFGPQWAISAVIGKSLAFMAPAYLLNFFMGPVLAAAGRSRASVKVAAVEVGVTVLMALIAAPLGLLGITVAYVMRAYVTMPYLLRVLKRETGIGSVVVASNMLPPLWASLFMSVILVAGEAIMSQHGISHIGRATIGIALGVVAYALGLLMFARQFLASQYTAILPLLSVSAAKSVPNGAAGPILR